MNRTRLCGSTPAVLLVALLGSWPSCIVEISSEEPAGDRAMTAASGEESGVGDLGSLYSWSEALARGVVDINFNPWETARGYRQIVENITRLSPGIVYRLGFLYGGPTQFFLSKQQELLQELRARLPQAHFNAALPQQITKGYSVTLACPGATSAEKPTTQTFTYSDLTGLDSTSGVQYGWLDFSRTRVKEYYLCLGKIFVAQGFTLIHFEDSAGLASKNSDPKKVWDTLIAVKKALEVFAAAQGKPIYWSGGPELSRRTAIQMVYLPARYYHLTTATQYQNRIARPEVGTSGYSYALSRKRITDAKMSTAPSVAIMFYIDNWDASQDDLRRMMELDRLNRRYLLRESGRVARDNGVYFIPSLNHCAGCIPQQIVGDACQRVLSRDGKFLYTMYDASACDDLDAIRDAMRPRLQPAKALLRRIPW